MPTLPLREPRIAVYDSDQLTAQIDQRAAGVAWVDGCVGLDEILIALDAQPRAPQSAHDAGRHRLTETERVADGHYEIANPQRTTVANGNFRQLAGLYLQQRQIGIGVGAHEPGAHAATIAQRHGDSSASSIT